MKKVTMKKVLLPVVVFATAVLLMLFGNLRTVKADEPETVKLQLLQQGEIPTQQNVFYKKKYRSASAADIETAHERIYNALVAQERFIDLRDLALEKNEAIALFQSIANESAQFFYVCDQVSFTPNNRGTNVTYLDSFSPMYLYDKTTVQTMNANYESWLKEITDQIQDSWSASEKALFAHDYIVANMYYDETYSIYDAYTLLEEHTGVCQAYALLFKAVMTAKGVPCELVTSEEICHAWNKVQTENGWYSFDATWDDPLGQAHGMVRHDYCFETADENLHEIEEEYIAAMDEISTTAHPFTAKVRGINSPLAPFKNGWTYMQYCCLKYTEDLTTFLGDTVLADYPRQYWKYRSTSQSASQMNGATCYAYGGDIYYNLPDTVYKYDAMSGRSFLVYQVPAGASNKICGLTKNRFGVQIGWQEGLFDGSLPTTITYIAPSVTLKGASLSVTEDLKIRVYLILAGDVRNLRVEATDELSQTWTTSDYGYDPQSSYYVAPVTVLPQQIGDTLSLHVKADGGVDVSLQYGVKQYCNNIYQNYASNAQLCTLLADILEYGAAAQAYTGRQVTAANSLAWVASNKTTFTPVTTETTGYNAMLNVAKVAGAALDLGDRISIYFVVDTTSANEVKGSLSRLAAGSTLEETVHGAWEGVFLPTGQAALRTQPIRFCDIEDKFIIRLRQEGTLNQQISEFTYSVRSYVASYQNHSNLKLQNLIRSMWNYGLSATAYK